MKSIEKLVGIGKQELLQFYGLGHDAIPPKQDGRSYLEMPATGVSFVLSDDDHVTTVHLYSENRHEYSQYISSMPFGLSFAMSRDAVRSLLGKPERAMDAADHPLLGKMMARDIFTHDEYSVSVEYMPRLDGISLISISHKR